MTDDEPAAAKLDDSWSVGPSGPEPMWDELGPGWALHYDLDGKACTLRTWARLMQDPASRFLRRSRIGPYVLSTVWLGIDHAFGDDQKPLIFESMVFLADGWYDDSRIGLPDLDMQRYPTREQALAGHEEMITVVRASVPTVLDSTPVELDGFLAGRRT